jgi:integrase
MTRQVSDQKIETIAQRRKLAVNKNSYFRAIQPGKHIGFRKSAKASFWTVRVKTDQGYTETKLGYADDDRLAADGESILTYQQAVSKAIAFKLSTNVEVKTVGQAADLYMAWFRANRKSAAKTQITINRHILPTFKDVQLERLTTATIKRWFAGLSNGSRQAKATSNRILTVLKAILNHAYVNGLVDSDSSWRIVKPYRNVDVAKIESLSIEECDKLINACAPDFKQLVQAALYTAGRYGELTALKVGDFDRQTGTILFRETKNGKPRRVALSDDGRKFFTTLCLWKPADQTMLLRADGEPWMASHQARRMTDSCVRAGIKVVSFHILRHTAASLLAERGVPLMVIAKLLGHSDTRIAEKHYAHLSDDYIAKQIRQASPSFVS